jgi:GT2 family glycosyltransferase
MEPQLSAPLQNHARDIASVPGFEPHTPERLHNHPVAIPVSCAAVHPSVTIIIPSFNRASVLQSTLTQLRSQPFKDYEIWIIDQSDPQHAASNEIFIRDAGDARLNYLHISEPGPSNARNEGLARARGEIILFVDDDVILLTEDFIGAHVRAYENPQVGGVTGRHVERVLRMNAKHTACHVAWSGRTIFNLFGNERVAVGSCKGSNMSFRMKAIKQAGGFDRRLKFLEETDLSTRVANAGWRLMFEPNAEIFHLSAPAGGVREKDRLQAELVRFQCTAYYILKHRGWIGAAPFVATFSLIAILRAIRFRSPKSFLLMSRAMLQGFTSARGQPDEHIPAVQE